MWYIQDCDDLIIVPSFFIQILYSRLLKIKELSLELSKVPPPNEIMNPIAIEMGLQKPDCRMVMTEGVWFRVL